MRSSVYLKGQIAPPNSDLSDLNDKERKLNIVVSISTPCIGVWETSTAVTEAEVMKP